MLDEIEELYLARIEARIEQLERHLLYTNMSSENFGKLQDEIERLKGIKKQYEEKNASSQPPK